MAKITVRTPAEVKKEIDRIKQHALDTIVERALEYVDNQLLANYKEGSAVKISVVDMQHSLGVTLSRQTLIAIAQEITKSRWNVELEAPGGSAGKITVLIITAAQ